MVKRVCLAATGQRLCICIASQATAAAAAVGGSPLCTGKVCVCCPAASLVCFCPLTRRDTTATPLVAGGTA